MSIASEALKTAYSRSLTQIESVTGVTYTQDVKTPIFTLKTNPADREGDSATDLFGANLAGIQSADKQLNDAGKKLQGLHVPIESNVQEPELLGVREKHELSAGDKIKIIKIPNKDPDTTKSSALIEDQEYVIATVPSTGTFTLQGDIDTSKEDGVNPDEPSHYRTIEYKPTVRDGEDVEEIKIKLKGSLAQIFTGDNEFDLLNIKDSWYQAKLGNNPIFTAIAQKAAIASALLSVNIQFVQTGLDLSKVLLLAALNPQLLLLIAIADEIDKFVQDFKSTGIYFLPVMATSFAVEIPKDKDGNDIKLVSSGATMVVAYDAAIAAGIEYQGRTVVGKAEIAADINHTRDEFEKWARSSDGLNLGPALPDQIVSFRNQLQSGNFAIPQGATSAEVVGAIKTDMMIKSTAGGFGQVPRMTPSQVIATMIAAMNEFPRDPKAPNFSDSADVAAVIIIAGFPDFDKSIADVVELFELLGDWFGTDSPAMEAINVIKDIVNEADNFFKFNINAETEIKVTKVSGIRGGTGDEEELISTAIGGTQSPVESGTVEGAVSQVVQKGSAFSNFLYENTFASPFTGDPSLGTKDP